LYSLNGAAFGIIAAVHIAQRFEQLLDSYRHPDGSRWTGQQIDEATDGLVTRSYFVNLRKGRIKSPGHDKLAAIAETMGFPPAAWFEDGVGKEPELDWGLAGALRDETIRDAVRAMSRLSKRERRLVLGIVRQFGNTGELPSG
jgi:transcriptional regulator with XRE-family HTH domain